MWLVLLSVSDGTWLAALSCWTHCVVLWRCSWEGVHPGRESFCGGWDLAACFVVLDAQSDSLLVSFGKVVVLFGKQQFQFDWRAVFANLPYNS